jgi:predicted secreted Zn-dependent protease
MSTINFIFLAAVAFTPATAFAELVFDINNSNYKVQHDGNEPMTYGQLLAQRQDCNKQKPFVACTISNHRYSAELLKSPNGCEIAKLNLIIKIRVLLPDFGDLLPSEQARLLEFRNKLSDHEQGHVDIYTSEFNQLYDKVRAMTSDVSCEQLKRQVTQELKKGAEDIGVKQAKYDLQTRHGILQGSRFPTQQ